MKLIPKRPPEGDELTAWRPGARNGARKRKRSEKTSLADVARLAEVSTATVSRAINMPGKVSAAVRARIEAAVERLRYRPNIAARMLAAQRSWMVGAIVPTIQHNVFAWGLEAIQARLEEDGFTLLVGSSGYDPERELRLTEAFLGRGVDGLIYMGAAHLPAVFAALEANRVPFVNQGVFDEKAPHPCVGFDNREAAALAVRHLLDLGHRRIGMVAGISRDNDRAARRIEGFRETLAAAGDPAWPASVVEQPYTIEGGRVGLAALLAGAVPPTAVLCGNDILAQGVLFEAQARGLRVGRELSIIGFDDVELDRQLGLSTFVFPIAEMARLAAEYVVRRLAGETPPRATRVAIRVVARASTAPPAA